MFKIDGARMATMLLAVGVLGYACVPATAAVTSLALRRERYRSGEAMIAWRPKSRAARGRSRP